MRLSGPWHACAADDETRRQAVGLDYDASGWPTIDVPGHWRDQPGFEDRDGPVLYRTSFDLPRPEPGTRRFVRFDGIFTQADVWLDGAYLGDPEGYFFPHSFDITALSRLETEHVLAVEVSCRPEPGRTGRRNVTGMLQTSEAVPADWNPGGIWRPVSVVDTGPVRIDRVRVLCRDADESRAFLHLVAVLDSDAARRVDVVTTADSGHVASVEQALATGENEIEWTLEIRRPSLWWPHSLGDQPLTEIAVEVFVDGSSSDRFTRRTGLREVAQSSWITSINGERMFIKGANVPPTRFGLANADPDLLRADVARAVDAGLDAVRVQAHIAPPAFYEAADEAGLLILQDFPLHGSYARSVRQQAVRQARLAVDWLGHHPSIVHWNAHDEPVPDALAESGGGRFRRFVNQQVPTWNRSVLDRWVKRTIEKADPTRPTEAHSGVAPHLPQLNGTDSHLWYGWHDGEIADLDAVAKRIPRLVRFVTEFGAPSVPAGIERHLEVDRWPELDWDLLATRFQADVDGLRRRFPPAEFATFEGWAAATRHYQARLLARQIVTLRRLKYRPVGGFCFSWLADPGPLVSPSVLDDRRVPKPAFDAVRDACAPVLATGEPLGDFVTVGDHLSVPIHVINDLHRPLPAAELTARWTWPGGQRRQVWTGDVDADECVFIGTAELVVSEQLGELALDIELRSGELVVGSRQTTSVTVAPD